MRNTILICITTLLSLSAIACSNMNDPYYDDRYQRNGRYYDDGRYDPRYNSNRYYNQRERDRIEQERRDIAIERDRLERERAQARREQEQARRPSAPVRETCPSGWRPGRCSKKDRKHGCKDKRMPGGLGCRTN